MKQIYLGLVLATFSSAALATDLPLPTKAPPMMKAPVYQGNWAGFYIGGHGGYATSQDGAFATFNPLTFAQSGANTNIGALDFLSLPFVMSAEPKGGFGGVQIGYNWQAAGSSWVFGLEADASFGRIRGGDANGFAVLSDNDDVIGIARLQQAIDAFGTVRGRVGYAFDTVLLYATGGFAWANIETKLSVDIVGGNLTPAQIAGYIKSASKNSGEFGYAVGAGGEWAFNRNWSLKAEYIYLGFESGGGTLTLPGSVATISPHLHTAKGGINYRF